MKQFDPNEIVLESTTKLFEYEKLSRQIEGCDNIDILKDIARFSIKLFMKQQETVRNMGLTPMEQSLSQINDDES